MTVRPVSEEADTGPGRLGGRDWQVEPLDPEPGRVALVQEPGQPAGDVGEPEAIADVLVVTAAVRGGLGERDAGVDPEDDGVRLVARATFRPVTSTIRSSRCRGRPVGDSDAIA
jgi:hypothetical protein